MVISGTNSAPDFVTLPGALSADIDHQISVRSESDKIWAAVVEDDETFLNMLASVLQSSGNFTVTAFQSGEDFVGTLPGAQYDLAILDHKMGGISGLNVLQQMHEEKIQIPVIMLTGAGDETIAVEAMKLGAYDYVRKENFDRHHFPILAAGVYERYLFRLEKESRFKQDEKSLVSLEALSQSISAMTLLINTTLTTISSATEEAMELNREASDSKRKELLEQSLREIQQEYSTIVTTTKSIVELSRLIIERVAGMVRSSRVRDLTAGLDMALPERIDKAGAHPTWSRK